MKNIIVGLLVVATLLAGCQSKNVYTDQNGKHYNLKEVCISSHVETTVQLEYSYQLNQYIPVTHTDEVCDSVQTHIIYIDK